MILLNTSYKVVVFMFKWFGDWRHAARPTSPALADSMAVLGFYPSFPPNKDCSCQFFSATTTPMIRYFRDNILHYFALIRNQNFNP